MKELSRLMEISIIVIGVWSIQAAFVKTLKCMFKVCILLYENDISIKIIKSNILKYKIVTNITKI